MRLFLTLLLTAITTTALAQSKWTPYTENNSRIAMYIKNDSSDTAMFRNVVRLYTTATIGDTFFRRTSAGISNATTSGFDCEEWVFDGVQNGSMVFSRSTYTAYRSSTDQFDSIFLDQLKKATVGSKDWGQAIGMMCSRDKAYNHQITTDTLYVPLPTSPTGTTVITPSSLWNQGFLTLSFDPKFNELTAALH